jgi:hypothetical protein
MLCCTLLSSAGHPLHAHGHNTERLVGECRGESDRELLILHAQPGRGQRQAGSKKTTNCLRFVVHSRHNEQCKPQLEGVAGASVMVSHQRPPDSRLEPHEGFAVVVVVNQICQSGVGGANRNEKVMTAQQQGRKPVSRVAENSLYSQFIIGHRKVAQRGRQNRNRCRRS